MQNPGLGRAQFDGDERHGAATRSRRQRDQSDQMQDRSIQLPDRHRFHRDQRHGPHQNGGRAEELQPWRRGTPRKTDQVHSGHRLQGGRLRGQSRRDGAPFLEQVQHSGGACFVQVRLETCGQDSGRHCACQSAATQSRRNGLLRSCVRGRGRRCTSYFVQAGQGRGRHFDNNRAWIHGQYHGRY